MHEGLSKILKNPVTIPVIVGVTSFAGGVGAGYFLANRRKVEVYELPRQLELDFKTERLVSEDEIKLVPVDEEVVDLTVSEIEIEPSDKVVRILPIEPKPDLDDLEEYVKEKVLDDLEERIEEERAPKKDSVLERYNAFTNKEFAASDEDWDYEIEVANRNPDEPYILHKDEFYQDEMDLSQTTLTYYAGDDIMVDEEEKPLYNYAQITGPLQFGHGSDGDPNVFYIRNEKRRAEYEVLYDTGSYAQEILGVGDFENTEMERDLKHSNSLRKFRPE